MLFIMKFLTLIVTVLATLATALPYADVQIVPPHNYTTHNHTLEGRQSGEASTLTQYSSLNCKGASVVRDYSRFTRDVGIEWPTQSFFAEKEDGMTGCWVSYELVDRNKKCAGKYFRSIFRSNLANISPRHSIRQAVRQVLQPDLAR